MFLVSVPKCPTCLIDVLHCASQMVTLVSIDNTSFVGPNMLLFLSR